MYEIWKVKGWCRLDVLKIKFVWRNFFLGIWMFFYIDILYLYDILIYISNDKMVLIFVSVILCS